MSANAMKTDTHAPALSVASSQAAPQGAVNDPKTAADRQALLTEIRMRWNKFTVEDLAEVKSSAELSQQLVAKYGIPHTDAQRQVTGLLKGRTL